MAAIPQPLQAAVSLAGTWKFATDPADEGERLRWYDTELSGTIHLPGSMAEQNLGDEITTATIWTGDVHNRSWFELPAFKPYAKPGQFKFPYWLTPRKHYVGAGWYQRSVDISATDGQQLQIHLERAHWRTTAWLDDQLLGTRDSLSVPHDYDLPNVKPGKHRLTIRVDNRLQSPVGSNAHSVTDHTQTNWNGIIGSLELRTLPAVHVEAAQVFPAADAKSARVTVQLIASTAQDTNADLELVCTPKNRPMQVVGRATANVHLKGTTASTEIIVPLTQPVQQWDEFNAALYELRVSAINVAGDKDPHANVSSTAFGFRDFRTSGTQFVINDRPCFLRGTLECCIFPLTGYPPTTVEPWKRILTIARAHGLNHLRFHSWCPPEAAFLAADEMGFYYSIECCSWTTVAENSAYEKWLYAEAQRIVDAYGNHPSFCMMLYGNEPHGNKQKQFLAYWDQYWTARDTRRLYSGGAGWPVIPENQFHITPTPRIARGVAMNSRINARPPETETDYAAFIEKQDAPVISHEIGQWCVYPNLAERKKYTGALRALNFDIFADSLAQHHMADQAHDFLIASGKLQALCYKEEIESALRTPGMAGFQLLDLHDFPGQGTALVGVLDPFWDEKGYITAAEYHRFACETVPLLRLGKRVFNTDEILTASLEVTHYGRAALTNTPVAWRLHDESGAEFATGRMASNIPIGSATRLCDIRSELRKVHAPAKLSLEASIGTGDTIKNSWDVWVYPSQLPEAITSEIHVTRRLDTSAEETLRAGGKVLLIPEASAVKGTQTGAIKAGFSTIFWNTAWFPKQEPVTLGILCNPKHRLFSSFPTEFHTNWQWWYVLQRSQCMLLDGLPADVRPLVQMIDDWSTNRRLGLLFEAQYGGGKLMVCSVNLTDNLQSDPVSGQFKSSLMKYMASSEFAPEHGITRQQLGTVTDMNDAPATAQ
jgi:hypothetical protein